MTSIDLTPQLAEAIRVRLTREYGEVCATNFALDILVEALQVEVERLREHISALQERVAKQDQIIEDQKISLGSKAAARKRAMRADKTDGADLQ